jgi:hypothetical protein
MERVGNDSVVLATDTYLRAIEQGDEMLRHLDSLGFTRSPDDERQVDLPMTLDELKTALSRKNELTDSE